MNMEIDLSLDSVRLFTKRASSYCCLILPLTMLLRSPTGWIGKLSIASMIDVNRYQPAIQVTNALAPAPCIIRINYPYIQDHAELTTVH